MKNTILRICFTMLFCLVCMQFGTRPSEDKKEKPARNFYGQLITAQGKTYDVENITIGGRHTQIPFYTEPLDPQTDPSIDTSYVDLDEVQRIYPTQEKPRDGVKKFKNREYIQLTIVYKGAEKKEDHFIIENWHKVLCDVANDGNSVEKKIAFEGIKNLSIEGSKENKPQGPAADRREQPSAAQQAICSDTQKLIEQLEKETSPESQKMVAELKKNLTQLCR